MSDIDGHADLDDGVEKAVEDQIADAAEDQIEDAADDLEPVDDALAPTATEVLRYLVKALVDDPDAVHVDAIERRRGVLLEVRVAQGELGRVIGRKGRTAQSLRTVARAAATRDDVTVDVDFVD